MRPPEIHRHLDLRRLLQDGVEPFPIVLEGARALPTSVGLVVVVPFLPSPWIELLKSEGFLSSVERGHGTDWVVTFWRA